MVYKLPSWFVFEPGDTVLDLLHCRSGVVVASDMPDFEQKTQEIVVQYPRSEPLRVDAGSVDLLRGIPHQPQQES